ncbi:MAG: hypothetical protein K0U98_26865 [Deltaproteobacteria bacterium]|nr:hypothetical protein [Deltaproteobacteria bacterium]
MAETKRNFTTFVVHGVGAVHGDGSGLDPATRDFAETWASRAKSSLRWQRRTIAAGSGASTDYWTLTGPTSEGGQHRIVQLQWADLSSAPHGPFAAVTSFFLLLFGLRRVSRAAGLAAAEQPSRFSRLTDWALGWIEGPLLGLNALLLSVFLMYAYWPWKIEAEFAMPLAGLFTIAIAGIASRVWQDLRIAALPWAALSGALAMVMPLLPTTWMPWVTGHRYEDYLKVLRNVIQGFWFATVLAVAVATIWWLLTRWRLKRPEVSSYDIQIFTSVLALRIWVLIIPALWYLILLGTPDHAPSELLTKEQVIEIRNLFVPSLALGWIVILCTFLALLWSVKAFERRTKKDYAEEMGQDKKRSPEAATKQDPPKEKIEARIFASAPLIWTLNIVSLVAAGIILGYVIRGSLCQDQPLEQLGQQEYLRGLAWGLTGLSALAGLYLQGPLRTAIDFLLDVTNYFETPKDPGRADITARFRAVVENVLRESSPKESVLFLTHSQGSVLVGDFLMAHTKPEATWVSMGSPIGHLYGEYFQRIFWPDGAPEKGRDISAWWNLYRAQDYIGRDIPEDFTVVNHCLGPGGHRNYFGDPKVFEKLAQQGFLPPPVGDKKVAAP